MDRESKLEKLKNLQDILSEKITLEHEIQEIPKGLIRQEEVLTRLKKDFIEKNQDYEKIRYAESELKNMLREAESMREKAEKNMELISTQREYEALDKEIQDASKKEQQYRKELQQKDQQLADINEQVKQNTALIEQQELELVDSRADTEARLSEKKKLVDALVKKEKKITADLDPETVFKFERIIRKKATALVAIRGNVCMGCHMILPIQFANKVHIGEDDVFCPYCSRFLHYEESAEGEEEFFDTEDSGSLSDLDDLEEDFDEDDEEEEKETVTIDYEE